MEKKEERRKNGDEESPLEDIEKVKEIKYLGYILQKKSGMEKQIMEKFKKAEVIYICGVQEKDCLGLLLKKKKNEDI